MNISVETSIGRSRKHLGSVFILIALTLVSLALPPGVQAVIPPPDGGYPGQNTAEGDGALNNLNLNPRGATNNTALGYHTLFNLTTGAGNTATGSEALSNNVGGRFNTATGRGALFHNDTDGNTADGYRALFSNTVGIENTATGYQALFYNTTGDNNTATGYQALYNNTTSEGNTADGRFALYSNTTGSDNTAIGTGALVNNTTGSSNTAIGLAALVHNTTGQLNIAVGVSAGVNHSVGNSNIYIGNEGVDGENGTIRLGSGLQHTKTFIAAIRDVQTDFANAIPVLIDGASQLGTQSSSRRYKKEIKPMDKASEAVLALKPVTFHYKNDKTSTPQFGLVAEEVAEINPDLMVRDTNGEIYTVRYDVVNAMLLNEFLKEHRKNEEQEATIARLQKQIEALTADLQKVSAEIEMSKFVTGRSRGAPATKVVLDDP
jgi:hypothetical protein